MNESPQQFSKLGFVKTIVVPALTIFLIPAISLAFFWHAQARYDADIRESILEKVRSDPTLDELQRAEAIRFLRYDGWSQPLAFKHVVSFTLHESVRLQITYDREKVASEWIELQEFGTEQTAILNVVPKYHARSATAAAHHAERQKTQLAPPNEAALTGEA